MKIEIDDDIKDKIIIEALKWNYKQFKKRDHTIPVYSWDKDEETRELDKMQEAFRLVLDYYGCKVD